MSIEFVSAIIGINFSQITFDKIEKTKKEQQDYIQTKSKRKDDDRLRRNFQILLRSAKEYLPSSISRTSLEKHNLNNLPHHFTFYQGIIFAVSTNLSLCLTDLSKVAEMFLNEEVKGIGINDTERKLYNRNFKDLIKEERQYLFEEISSCFSTTLEEMRNFPVHPALKIWLDRTGEENEDKLLWSGFPDLLTKYKAEDWKQIDDLLNQMVPSIIAKKGSIQHVVKTIEDNVALNTTNEFKYFLIGKILKKLFAKINPPFETVDKMKEDRNYGEIFTLIDDDINSQLFDAREYLYLFLFCNYAIIAAEYGLVFTTPIFDLLSVMEGSGMKHSTGGFKTQRRIRRLKIISKAWGLTENYEALKRRKSETNFKKQTNNDNKSPSATTTIASNNNKIHKNTAAHYIQNNHVDTTIDFSQWSQPMITPMHVPNTSNMHTDNICARTTNLFNHQQENYYNHNQVNTSSNNNNINNNHNNNSTFDNISSNNNLYNNYNHNHNHNNANHSSHLNALQSNNSSLQMQEIISALQEISGSMTDGTGSSPIDWKVQNIFKSLLECMTSDQGSISIEYSLQDKQKIQESICIQSQYHQHLQSCGRNQWGGDAVNLFNAPTPDYLRGGMTPIQDHEVS